MRWRACAWAVVLACGCGAEEPIDLQLTLTAEVVHDESGAPWAGYPVYFETEKLGDGRKSRVVLSGDDGLARFSSIYVLHSDDERVVYTVFTMGKLDGVSAAWMGSVSGAAARMDALAQGNGNFCAMVLSRTLRLR